jgi:hypothetical protein
LNDADIDDAGMKQMPRLVHLRVLGLAGTKIGDAGLAALIEKNPEFWRLDVHKTLITDKSLAVLDRCKQLTNLHLLADGMKITPKAIEAFRKRNPHCHVD